MNKYRYTGFKDSEGRKIYGEDILTERIETDEGETISKRRVYWSNIHGAWMLDCSYRQDTSIGEFLHVELSDFDYVLLRRTEMFEDTARGFAVMVGLTIVSAGFFVLIHYIITNH